MLFSIVIPVYNRIEPLKRAVSSVLAQTCDDFEVIIVDDGSDKLCQLALIDYVAALDDGRITLQHHQRNINGAAARNTGIKLARGEYICFLDSDDEWLPAKLEKVSNIIGCFDNKKEDVLIHHQYQNKDFGIMGSPLPKKGMVLDEGVAHYSFVTNNVGGIQSSTITVNCELALKNQFNEALKGHQDWDFALRANAITQKFIFIPEVLNRRYRDLGSGVAKSLDWRFSLQFLKLYRSYFCRRSAAYYLERVVIKKALHAKQFWQTFFHPLSVIYWISYPLILGAILKRARQMTLLHKRVSKLTQQVACGDCNSMILWGNNLYSHLVLQSRRDHNLQVDAIIDAKAVEGSECLGVPIYRINNIPESLMNATSHIVLMTDRHTESMRTQLTERYEQHVVKLVLF